jgi:hypothetical protein
VLYIVEARIRAYGTFQRLGLIQPVPLLSWGSIMSFISVPLLGPEILFGDALRHGLYDTLKDMMLSPLIMAYPVDIIRRQIQARLQWVIFQTLPCPNDQGWSSGNTPFDDLPWEVTLVSSSRYHVTMPTRTKASLGNLLESAFPIPEIMSKFYARVKRWTGKQSREKSYEEQLKHAAEARYHVLVRTGWGGNDPNFNTDDQRRREAVRQVLEDSQVDPRGSNVNIQAWADDIHNRSASTGDRSWISNWVGSWMGLSGRSSLSQGQGQTHAGSFDAPMALDTLLQPAQQHSPSSPPTPLPGLSRAASLSQVPATSTTPPVVHPRPVRRPTEVEDSDSGTSSSGDTDDSWDPPIQTTISGPSAALSERVSLLSTTPAYNFAYFSSSFITSVVMLPFDVYFTRRLAYAFLSRNNSLSQSGIPILSDLWPTLPTRAIFSVSTIEMLGRLLLTLGIEAVAKHIAWSLGTRACVSLGKSLFLWGVRLRPYGRGGW